MGRSVAPLWRPLVAIALALAGALALSGRIPHPGWLVVNTLLFGGHALLSLLLLREGVRIAVALAWRFRIFQLRLGAGPALLHRRLGRCEIEISPLPILSSTLAASGFARRHRLARFCIAASATGAQLVLALTLPRLAAGSSGEAAGLAPWSVLAVANQALLAFQLLIPIETATGRRTDAWLLLDLLTGGRAADRASRARYYGLRAVRLLELGEEDRAEAVLAKAREQLGPDALLIALFGRLAERRGDLDEAARLSADAGGRGHRDRRIDAWLAQERAWANHFTAGTTRLEETQTCLARAERVDPEDPSTLGARAAWLLDRGELAAAEQRLDDALERAWDPVVRARLHACRARLEIRRNEPSRALLALEEARSEVPTLAALDCVERELAVVPAATAPDSPGLDLAFEDPRDGGLPPGIRAFLALPFRTRIARGALCAAPIALALAAIAPTLRDDLAASLHDRLIRRSESVASNAHGRACLEQIEQLSSSLARLESMLGLAPGQRRAGLHQTARLHVCAGDLTSAATLQARALDTSEEVVQRLAGRDRSESAAWLDAQEALALELRASARLQTASGSYRNALASLGRTTAGLVLARERVSSWPEPARRSEAGQRFQRIEAENRLEQGRVFVAMGAETKARRTYEGLLARWSQDPNAEPALLARIYTDYAAALRRWGETARAQTMETDLERRATQASSTPDDLKQRVAGWVEWLGLSDPPLKPMDSAPSHG